MNRSDDHSRQWFLVCFTCILFEPILPSTHTQTALNCSHKHFTRVSHLTAGAPRCVYESVRARNCALPLTVCVCVYVCIVCVLYVVVSSLSKRCATGKVWDIRVCTCVKRIYFQWACEFGCVLIFIKD